MEQPLAGRIDAIYPESGMVPVFRIATVITNRNVSAFDVLNTAARVYIAFTDAEYESGTYLGQAFGEPLASVVAPGDSNNMRFVFPVSFDLMDFVEDQRGDKNVVVQLELALTLRERSASASAGNLIAHSLVNDVRYGGNSRLSFAIPKSKWSEHLAGLGYSSEHRKQRERIAELIETTRKAQIEAQEAATEAKEAATGAKEAATLTAVTSLSQAYSQEAEALRRRSLWWLGSASGLAFAAGWVMVQYARASLSGQFTIPEALIRAVIIAAIFGAFRLCLRVYESYLHLEVVNRHRVNIGRTFEAFKAAQPTERSREIMAAITAEHMLTFGKSGFGAKDTPNESPFSNVTELMKSIIEKPKP